MVPKLPGGLGALCGGNIFVRPLAIMNTAFDKHKVLRLSSYRAAAKVGMRSLLNVNSLEKWRASLIIPSSMKILLFVQFLHLNKPNCAPSAILATSPSKSGASKSIRHRRIGGSVSHKRVCASGPRLPESVTIAGDYSFESV
jgi:hypothetical protein